MPTVDEARIRIPALVNVFGDRHRDCLQVDRGRHDVCAFGVPIEIVDDANLLHVGGKIVVDRVKALLQRKRGSDDCGEDRDAKRHGDQHFGKGKARLLMSRGEFHFLLPLEITVELCSVRLRPLNTVVQESETSTLTRLVPRLVAVESTVTLPSVCRVIWVVPLAVG